MRPYRKGQSSDASAGKGGAKAEPLLENHAHDTEEDSSPQQMSSRKSSGSQSKNLQVHVNEKKDMAKRHISSRGNINGLDVSVDDYQYAPDMFDEADTPMFTPFRGVWVPLLSAALMIAMAVLAWVFPEKGIWGNNSKVISHLVLLHLAFALAVYGVSVILLVNIRSELSKGYVALFKRVRWLSQLPKYLAFIGSGVLLFLWVLHEDGISSLTTTDVKRTMQIIVIVEAIISLISSVIATLHLTQHNSAEEMPEGVKLVSYEDEGGQVILVDRNILLYGVDSVDIDSLVQQQRKNRHQHNSTFGTLGHVSPRPTAIEADNSVIPTLAEDEQHTDEIMSVEQGRKKIAQLRQQMNRIQQANRTYQQRAAEAWEDKIEAERERDNVINILQKGSTEVEINEVVRKRHAEIEKLQREHASQQDQIDDLQRQLEETNGALQEAKKNLKASKSKYKALSKENEELHDQLLVEKKYIEELEKLVPAEQENLMSDTSEGNTTRSRHMSSSLLQHARSLREDSAHDLSHVSRYGRHGVARQGASGYASGPSYYFQPHRASDGSGEEAIYVGRSTSDSKNWN